MQGGIPTLKSCDRKRACVYVRARERVLVGACDEGGSRRPAARCCQAERLMSTRLQVCLE
jgi:hypothetical protein